MSKRPSAPRRRSLLALICAGAVVSACYPPPPQGVYAPVRLETKTAGEAMRPVAADAAFYGHRFDPAQQCKGLPFTPRIAAEPLTPHAQIRAQSMRDRATGPRERWRTAPLSPGDLLEVRAPEGEILNGTYVIGAEGTITVPYLPPITAAGRSLEEVEQRIEYELVENGLFQPHAARVDVTLRQLGELSVSVGGAVFQPGLIGANERTESRQDSTYDDALGADSWARRLSGVLKAAGGVRPDADLTRVMLRRGDRTFEFDMTGVFTGAMLRDPLVASGDYVYVPSRECFQADLVRLSRLTPPGIRVFISNPTATIYANNPAAVGGFSTRVPYGTRLLQGLVSGNCVGGANMVAAQRWAILVGENPLTGEPEAMRVDVQNLMLNPHREDLNPYLQPGDAIACYDSDLINLRDLGDVASSALSPVQIVRSLVGW